jgi:GNAT superfamily N-acetyltransferase
VTADDPPAGYPHELTELAFLDDGTPVELRAILPADEARLERLFYRLSPQSRYLRFFAPMARPSAAMLQRLANVDYVDRLALVALVGDEIVGVARYDRLAAVAPPVLAVDPGEAEAAVIVEDAWQARGIATRLLWRLSAAAVARGVHTFTGSILAENRVMLGLLRVLGEDVEVELTGSEYQVLLRLAAVRPPPGEPDPPAGDGRR